MRRYRCLSILAGALGPLVGVSLLSVTFALGCPTVDDFEDGTTQGWRHGTTSPNPPVNVPDGGPLGAGDAYLEVSADGGGGPGSRLVALNRAQWVGDLSSCDVASVECMMANLGATTLYMRIGLQSAGQFSRYVSNDAVMLPPDGVWRPVAFELSESAMTRISGTEPLAAVMADLYEVRLLSKVCCPEWPGDAIAGTVGIDNIAAVGTTRVDPVEAPPLATRLFDARPNPANPAATIRFSLAEGGRVRLQIHDAAGRLVRGLLDAVLEPGDGHEARWDGTTDSGDRVVSGVFFYHLEAPGCRATRKLVVLE